MKHWNEASHETKLRGYDILDAAKSHIVLLSNMGTARREHDRITCIEIPARERTNFCRLQEVAHCLGLDKYEERTQALFERLREFMNDVVKSLNKITCLA